MLWDLHEVVFTRSLFHWIYLFFTYQHKWEVIRSLDWHIISLCFRYFLHVAHIKRAELTSQELIDYARTKKLDRVIELVIRIACDYKPIPEVVAIIRTLHEQGYTQYIGSNIGIDVYNQFKKQYPTVFSYFDGAQIVHYKNGRLIKKPNPQFFIAFLETCYVRAEQVLFIDDKSYNVIAAKQVGMHAIQFKNAEQLTQELQKYLC